MCRVSILSYEGIVKIIALMSISDTFVALSSVFALITAKLLVEFTSRRIFRTFTFNFSSAYVLR